VQRPAQKIQAPSLQPPMASKPITVRLCPTAEGWVGISGNGRIQCERGKTINRHEFSVHPSLEFLQKIFLVSPSADTLRAHPGKPTSALRKTAFSVHRARVAQTLRIDVAATVRAPRGVRASVKRFDACPSCLALSPQTVRVAVSLICLGSLITTEDVVAPALPSTRSVEPDIAAPRPTSSVGSCSAAGPQLDSRRWPAAPRHPAQVVQLRERAADAATYQPSDVRF
jgi:hypothetical protein